MADNYEDRFHFSEALLEKQSPSSPAPVSEPVQTLEPLTDESRQVLPSAPSDKTGGRVKKAQAKKGQAQAEPDDKSSYVSIPKNIVMLVRSMLPADNVSDAVSAYLYITTGRSVSVSDKIRALAAGYEDDAGVSDLQQEVIGLRQEIRLMHEQALAEHQATMELQMALIWLVGERKGLVNVMSVPEKTEFLFPEYDALARRMKQQALEYNEQLKLRNGREIYKARFTGGK